LSFTKCRSKPHFRAVELTQLGVMEEDPMHVFVHLFQQKPAVRIGDRERTQRYPSPVRK